MISLPSAAVGRGRGAAACLAALLGCSAALLPSGSAAAQAQAPRPEPRSVQSSSTATTSHARPAQPAPSSSAPATTAAPASAATGSTTNTPPVSDVPTTPTPEVPPTETRAQPAEAALSPAAVAQAERRQIIDELAGVETQLEMVDQQRHDGSIAGPVAMLASGYTTGIIALGVSLASFAMAEQVQKRDPNDQSGGRLDINNDGSVDGDDEATYRRVARGLGIASAVGFAVGIAGNVILAKRMRERREHDPEIRQLQRRRRELRRELDYGGSASATGLSLSLGARF